MGIDLWGIFIKYDNKKVNLVFKDGKIWVGYIRGIVPETSDVEFERWWDERSLIRIGMQEVDFRDVLVVKRHRTLTDFL